MFNKKIHKDKAQLIYFQTKDLATVRKNFYVEISQCKSHPMINYK